MNELTKQQIERQDFVDNSIFELMQRLNPSNREIELNIEMIGDVRDVIEEWLVERLHFTDIVAFYPFVAE